MLIDQIRDAKQKFENFMGEKPQHIYLSDELYDHLAKSAGKFLSTISPDNDETDYILSMKLHHLQYFGNNYSNYPSHYYKNHNCMLSYDLTGYEIFRSYYLEIKNKEK